MRELGQSCIWVLRGAVCCFSRAREGELRISEFKEGTATYPQRLGSPHGKHVDETMTFLAVCLAQWD